MLWTTCLKKPNIFSSKPDVQWMFYKCMKTRDQQQEKFSKLLDVTPQSQAESKCLRFLQQYIRELDVVGLRKMLRFVTGSDVVCVDKIQVIFTSLNGLARRPVAYTCGQVLELPSTYNSYPELRSEMESILSSTHVLVMDIV